MLTGSECSIHPLLLDSLDVILTPASLDKHRSVAFVFLDLHFLCHFFLSLNIIEQIKGTLQETFSNKRILLDLLKSISLSIYNFNYSGREDDISSEPIKDITYRRYGLGSIINLMRQSITSIIKSLAIFRIPQYNFLCYSKVFQLLLGPFKLYLARLNLR